MDVGLPRKMGISQGLKPRVWTAEYWRSIRKTMHLVDSLAPPSRQLNKEALRVGSDAQLQQNADVWRKIQMSSLLHGSMEIAHLG